MRKEIIRAKNKDFNNILIYLDNENYIRVFIRIED